VKEKRKEVGRGAHRPNKSGRINNDGGGGWGGGGDADAGSGVGEEAKGQTGCIESKIKDESVGSRPHESKNERRDDEERDETYDSQRDPSVPEELRKMLHGLCSGFQRRRASLLEHKERR
jgi:hypothetical protein